MAAVGSAFSSLDNLNPRGRNRTSIQCSFYIPEVSDTMEQWLMKNKQWEYYESHFALTWSTKRDQNRLAMTWNYSSQSFLVIELLSVQKSHYLPSLDTEPSELNDKAQKEPPPDFFFKSVMLKSNRIFQISLEQTRRELTNVTQFLQDRQKLLGFVSVLTFTLMGKYFLWCINILWNQITNRSTTLASFFSCFLFWVHLTKFLRLALNSPCGPNSPWTFSLPVSVSRVSNLN